MNLYTIPPFVTLICFIALAILTIARWRKSTVNLLFLLICVLCSGLYTDILFIFNAPSAEAALFATRLDQFFSLFLIPLYVHFFHAYLGIRGRKWLLAAFYAVPVGLLWFGMTPSSRCRCSTTPATRSTWPPTARAALTTAFWTLRAVTPPG